jgi:UDP-glucose 4-epimerase
MRGSAPPHMILPAFHRIFVTGAAGFIGSNLVDRLLSGGHEVVGYDNFSTGFDAFLQNARTVPGFTLVRGDLLDADALGRAMAGCQLVFHLAANADVRFGLNDRGSPEAETKRAQPVTSSARGAITRGSG